MGITSAARAATNTLEGHPTCGVHADTSTISGVVSRFVFGGATLLRKYRPSRPYCPHIVRS